MFGVPVYENSIPYNLHICRKMCYLKKFNLQLKA